MNLDNYLIAGFNVLVNNTITISGFPSIPCVFDGSSLANEKSLNFMEDIDIPVIVATFQLNGETTQLIGKKATINGELWRIKKVRIGLVTSYIYLETCHK